jgi:hypothetical protein
VLNNIVGGRAVLGNPMLRDIAATSNWDSTCVNPNTYAGLTKPTEKNPYLVICPKGFKHGSFDGPIWPDVAKVNCGTIGGRVSWKMITLGHIFVHQYLFFQAMEGETLQPVGGKIVDLAEGPIEVLAVDKNRARVNADSYAWFVTELAWTVQCGWGFRAPVAGDDKDPL